MSGHHFHRSRPARCTPIERSNAPVILLVTVCSRERRDILANPPVHEALVAVWRAADRWLVGRYMIMPDHIHLFCSPGEVGRSRVRPWVGYWKRKAGEVLPALASVFQKDCWDRQMRDAEHYERRLEYVRQNPVRAGLVEDAEEWPYQGTIHDLVWHR